MAKAKAADSAAEARVLLDHDGHKVNEIVTGETAERAAAEGWGDPHPDAVAYAKSLSADAEEAPAAPTPREKRDALAEEKDAE